MLPIIPCLLLFQDIGRPKGFWEGFDFAASAHLMVIAAAGSLLGESILALNAYRQNRGMPDYYTKRGFWFARLAVVLGATFLPWVQGIKDVGVDRLVPFEIGLCAELLLSRIMSHD